MTLILFYTYDEKIDEELWEILEDNYNVCIPSRTKKWKLEIRDNNIEEARKQYNEIMNILNRGGD